MGTSACIDFVDGEQSLKLGFSQPHTQLNAFTLPEVLPVIAAAEQAAFAGFWVVGFVAYEAAPAFENLPVFTVSLAKLESGIARHSCANRQIPLVSFYVFATAQPFAAAIAEPDSDAVCAGPAHTNRFESGFSCGPWQLETPKDHYLKAVEKLREGIAQGEYYQVNLTQRLVASFSGDPLCLFKALHAAQPGGYAFYMDGGPWQIASVSPELFFKTEPDTQQITTKPMKGTAPLGRDIAKAVEKLKHSVKDRAENLMIVDLLRNDLSRVASMGSVNVARLFEVEKLPSLLQMTSTITARLKDKIGLCDVFKALFPCGSVTGAPKRAAMAAIAQTENSERQAYCGALGVIKPGGAAIFNVGIRTVVIANGQAQCGVGGGIIFDSSANDEYAEMLLKRRFLLQATAGFELLETMRLEGKHILFLRRHLRRMAKSAAYFGFPFQWKKLFSVLRSAVGSAAAEEQQHATALAADAASILRLRLLMTADGIFRAEIAAQEKTPALLSCCLAATPISSRTELLAHKTTDRSLYEKYVPLAGCFDVLLYNENDEITEFTRGNVAVDFGEGWVTPPLKSGVLPGIRREYLIQNGELKEQIITRSSLGRAQRIKFINALRGEIPVVLKKPEK